LARLTRSVDERSLLGDLKEEFEEICDEKGFSVARLWYWKHMFRSALSYIFFHLYWSFAMITNYMKIALRIIKRQKGYSFINITGLAVGFATFLIIFLFIQWELSYDRYHLNSGCIYRVAQKYYGHDHAGKDKIAMTPYPLGKTMVASFPEVVSSVRIVRRNEMKISAQENSYFENMVFFTDPDFFTLFTFPFVSGKCESALRDPNSIVISERMKEKYFGSHDAMGKTIRLDEAFDLKVTGVMVNMPKNGHFVTDIVIPLETYRLMRNQNLDEWRGGSGYTYILLTKEASPVELEKKFPALVEKYITGGGRHRRDLFLQPLTKIHLNPNLDAELGTTIDVRTLYLFGTIAVLILFIACINYMNLSTARSVQRMKEVGIRKVVGARRQQLIGQFFSEAILFTLIAFLLSFLLISLALPIFSRFVERELSLAHLYHFRFILWIVALILFVGLLAGSYPALTLSRFRPICILKTGLIRVGKRMSLRSVLVILQFAISIVLIVCTFTVRDQLQFIQHHDVGYERDQIAVISIKDPEVRENFETIKTELKRNPNILSVSSSTYLPNRILDQTTFNWPGREEDLEIGTYFGNIDYDYVDLFELKIVEGRNISRDFQTDAGGAFLINETAVKSLGWDKPVGRELIHWNENKGRIVGVLKDFNFHSLHREIESLTLYLEPRERNYHLSVKIRGGHIPETIETLKNTMTRFSSGYPFEYRFFDDIFNDAYRSELRLEQIFIIFAFIAIFIACLGLLGLAAFAANQRTKEIGIRKVVGASVSSIVFLLSKEFVKWVLIANVIGWPVAWFTMKIWLQDFAYRTHLGPGLFFFSTLMVVIIALCTVSYQAIKAARTNPVKSLRYE